MANQATAKKGEEYEIDSQNRVLFERIEKQQKGLTAKKQAADLTGTTDQEILSGKNDNIVDFLEFKAKKLVNSKIDSISKELTSDPEKQKAVSEEVEKMVQGELRTEAEDIDSLTKIVEGDEIKAVKAVKIAREMVLENPKEVRLYREETAGNGDNLSDKEKGLLKKGSLDNDTPTKEDELLKKGLLNRQKKLAEEVASAAGIENQEQAVMEKFRDESPGKTEMAFRHVEMAMGLKRMSSERREAVLAENSKINSELGRFKSNIPSNEISKKVLALDGVAAYLGRNKRSLGYMGSSQGGSSFLVRFKMTFYNLRNVLIGKRTANDNNGFLATIGGQPADVFVSNSVGSLLNSGNLDSGLKEIFAGLAGKGVNAAVKNLAGDAALKLAGGALGPAGVAASKVLGALKKFFGNAGSKLGISARDGIGNAVDKGGSFLGKAAMGLGVLLGSIGFIGTATASTVVSGAVVGGVSASYVYNMASAGAMVSTLVTAQKACDSEIKEYIKATDKPPIPCENMDSYTEEMREKILASGYQTRCAVAASAQYLIFDFPYLVPYHLGGYAEGDMGIDDDWCTARGGAMDCMGLVRWAYRQGGFAITKQTSTMYWEGNSYRSGSSYGYAYSVFKTNTLNFVPSNCEEIKERVGLGDIVRVGNYSRDGWMHGGMVIGFDDTTLQIAEEGVEDGKWGLNVCYVNICTGKGRGLEHACNDFDRISLMDTFFDYYAEGGQSINGYTVSPNSDTILEFPEYDKN